MASCMNRRLLYASSQAYHPDEEICGREVGWLEEPMVIRREAILGHRVIDVALVGPVAEGIVVAFRGSLSPIFGGPNDGWEVLLDWLNDALSICVDVREFGGGVHLGFADSMRRLWNDANGSPGVRSAVQMLLDRQTAQHLFFTGHSKGGALANLAAYRSAGLKAWWNVPITVATIAAARAGNREFALSYAATRIACLRYELPGDLVPHLPPGPLTPPWVRGVARQIFPGLATSDYHPVGKRVSLPRPCPPLPVPRACKRLSWRSHRRWKLFDVFTPTALSAHAISPRSAYDALVGINDPCLPAR